MSTRSIPPQALTPTLLRYLASGLTREPDADLAPGFGMPEDTIRLHDPDVVLSVTCVCPPMFRASVMKLARAISRDVALVRCCQTILDPLPVAIDVVLASGGHVPMSFFDLALYRGEDSAIWFVPGGFGASIELTAEGLTLHLVPPYPTLAARADGIYRATADLADLLFAEDAR